MNLAPIIKLMSAVDWREKVFKVAQYFIKLIVYYSKRCGANAKDQTVARMSELVKTLSLGRFANNHPHSYV